MTERIPYLFLTMISGLFLYSLHPTMTAGDSGEIVAAAFSLGVPHPSGYPLYVIMAKPFTLLLPFGSAAYRVNILSAVFGALSCFMVYLITSKIIRSGVRSQESGANVSRLTSHISHLPALFASLSLALSYEFWYRSTVAEVYTLNTFLILLIIYVLVAWRDTVALLFMGNVHSLGVNPNAAAGLRPSRLTPHDSRLLYLAAFLLGLGIGNHHTIVLVIPGALVFVLLNTVALPFMGNVYSLGINPNATAGLRPSRLTSHVSRLTFFFLLGLSVYLYLPVRSIQNPFMDWGNPQNLQNFIDVFTRRTYLPEEVGRDWGMLINQLKTFNPVYEFTVIGSAFGLIGVWGIWRWDKQAATMILLILILTSYGLIFLAGSSATDLLKKFYLPAYSVFSILIGVGVATILKPGVSSTSQPLNSSTTVLCSTSHASRLTLLLAAVSLIWQIAAHYPRADNSGNYLAYDYGMNELNSLKDGAVYVSKGEIKTFPLWYLQGVERYREDVSIITAYFLTQRWYLKEVLREIGVPGKIPEGLTYRQLLIDTIYKRNRDRGIYTGFLDEEYIPKWLHTYTRGITFHLYRDPEEKLDMDVWPMYQMRGIGKLEKGMDRGIVEILKDYASSHYNIGIEYYSEGLKERAMAEFEKALAIDPDEPDYLNNVAVLYAEKGIRLAKAEEMTRRAIELYEKEEDKALAGETLKEILKKRKKPLGEKRL